MLEIIQQLTSNKAYDLWSHNCNNFSNDFATFLLGKGIPEHITNLPQTVLDTPFGRMIQPQINNMIQNRKAANNGLVGLQQETVPAPRTSSQLVASVRKPTTLRELERLLAEVERSCAAIFFTSPTCAPCKTLYPLYDELAAEAAHKASIIMVDISQAHDISAKYGISATPTFITFLHGQQENKWSGADPNALRGNIRMLIQMAWPPHKHDSMHLPTLRKAGTRPVLYNKPPPLEKLKAKLGPTAEDPAISGVMRFVSNRTTEGAAESTLPNLDSFSSFLSTTPSKLPSEVMFTVVDLLRSALIDSRFSGYFAEERDHKTIVPLFSYVATLANCPYPLRLVTLQAACNLFSSPLYPEHILGCPSLTDPIVQLITTSLLDDKHHNVRVAAASLSFNIAAANSRIRSEECRDLLPESVQVELAASLLEAISVEENSSDALKGFLLALGYLVYCAPKNGELVDLLVTMDAQSMLLAKKNLFPNELLIEEIGKDMIGNGLY
jgi:thiol-disulfide isomerase/thioredoxin